MKRKIMIMSMLVFAVLYGTTACTSTDSIYGQNYSQTGGVSVNTAPHDTGVSQQGSSDGTAYEGSTGSDTAASQGSGTLEGANNTSGEVAPENSTGVLDHLTAGSDQSTAQTSPDTDSAQNQTVDSGVKDASEFEGEFQFGGQDGTDAYSLTPGNDIWTGTYDKEEDEWTEESDAEPSETIDITYPDEEHIHFTFKNAGISGLAEIKGNQAVYRGDDHFVIVFSVSGNLIDISITNEEDFDGSDSPMNGTYIKQ